MMIMPLNAFIRYTFTPSNVIILFMIPRISIPKSAPDILPLPPSIEMPPITVMAMAFSSYALPDDVGVDGAHA